MRFDGKVAIVTGGASGIGRATAARFAAEGATVIVGDIDEAGGAALADASDGRIRFLRTDVSQEDDIRALIEAARAAGGPDILFNNAGAGGLRAKIDEIDAAGWDATMALLLRSVALGMRHAAPVMAAKGGGAIVNTASVAALAAGAAPTAYSVAKAGVLHLTKVGAADLAKHRIRVNAVLPGFIATNIFVSAVGLEGEIRTQANMAIEQMASNAQPIRRTGRPEDIAAAVTFLASEDASFITGTSLLVDGGMSVGPRHSWDSETPGLFDMLLAMAPQ
jgi:NAD(P)-dependent dehydrogenase (short-subunit alcohol dehydrogenase family)